MRQMYEEGRSVQDFAFIDQYSRRGEATLPFASVLRCIHNHPDWAQLHAFFSKRSSRVQLLSDRAARKLAAPPDYISFDDNPDRTVTVRFRADPSSVGLARDLAAQLARAGRAARERMLGPDPQPCAIGP